MHKPLQINPIKHAQPMGATLAFLGVEGCLSLMHGAQGCASYTKVFFTRHFNEPIAIRNTSVSDITAILDGGDYSILMAIENILTKDPSLKPSLIGLHTTGLTETKGDDIRGVGSYVQVPYVYVHTPDYEGGMESGWALSVEAMITQLSVPSTQTRIGEIAILPHVSLTPIEIEKLKLFALAWGFTAHILPDLSTSLDGHLGPSQGKLAQGGIDVEAIRNLAGVEAVISIGASMHRSGEKLCALNPSMRHYPLSHVMGLEGCDNFVAILMQLRPIDPPLAIRSWRGRLQDAMLDTHFLIGSSRFVLIGEPDLLCGLAQTLLSVGGTLHALITTVSTHALDAIDAEHCLVGDLEDAQKFLENADLVIGNFHAERILHAYPKSALVLRGFPNYEELGNALKHDVLYEGSCYFLFEIANALRKVKHAH